MLRWEQDDTIPLGRERILRVIEVTPAQDRDGDPTLVVIEDERFRF